MSTLFRLKENRAGVVYDETKKQVLFVEDIQAIEQAINTLENILGADVIAGFADLTARLSNIEQRLSALE